MHTKQLTLAAMLVAVCLIMGLTPLGYFMIGPLKVTLLCVPVVIGAICCGRKTGLILGLTFAITSLISMITAPSPLQVALLTDGWSWVKYILITFIPRLMVPLTAYGVYKAIRNKYVGLPLASIAGSLTNTVLYLGMIMLLFIGNKNVSIEILLGIAATNGLLEAAVCAVLCTPIVLALGKNKLE